MTPSMTFEYKFNAAEVEALTKFLRAHMGSIPDELSLFARSVENAVYDCMTVQEAEHLLTNHSSIVSIRTDGLRGNQRP